jgi:peroxiredoxin
VLKLSDFRGKKTVVLAFFVAAFTGSLCHLGAPCYICCF